MAWVRRTLSHFSLTAEQFETLTICITPIKDEADLDPEDVDLDEQYTNTIETRSKCKRNCNDCSSNFSFSFSFSLSFSCVLVRGNRFLCGFCVCVDCLARWLYFVFAKKMPKNRAPKIWTPTPNSSQLKTKLWKLVADVIYLVFLFVSFAHVMFAFAPNRVVEIHIFYL